MDPPAKPSAKPGTMTQQQGLLRMVEMDDQVTALEMEHLIPEVNEALNIVMDVAGRGLFAVETV